MTICSRTTSDHYGGVAANDALAQNARASRLAARSVDLCAGLGGSGAAMLAHRYGS